MSQVPTVALCHPFDPWGTKIGGLETFSREFIRHAPERWSIRLLGVTEDSSVPVGTIVERQFEGRPVSFLPIMQVSEGDINKPPVSLAGSLTFRFVKNIFLRWFVVKRFLSDGVTSLDLRRVEFSFLAAAVSMPFCQMLHGEGVPPLAMDSVLRRHRYVHTLAERHAVKTSYRFFVVADDIARRIKATYPAQSNKIETVTTWYNSNFFYPAPFEAVDEVRIFFCGRLDSFKDPEMMLKTVFLLKQRGWNVKFHYAGPSDPHRLPTYSKVSDVTVRHGTLDAKSVGEVIRHCHVCLLTSLFEGMPRVVIESLGCGRPVVVSNLPQLRPVVRRGVNGVIAERHEPECYADGLVTMLGAIRRDEVSPSALAASVADFSPSFQLGKVYSAHEEIARLGMD
jgi:glycosyltransferase involved in cell wall biosynthesis